MDGAEVQTSPERDSSTAEGAQKDWLVNRQDDDFLAQGEPSALPRGGGWADGSSGYAGGLRRAEAGRRARRDQLHKERRVAHSAYVVAAIVMGAAVVAAAAFAVLVFAGAFPSSPGGSTRHRTETLERQSSATTAPSSSSTTSPPSPGAATEIDRPVLPPPGPVAIRGTTTRAPTPARPSATQTPDTSASSSSTAAGQVSSASSRSPSGARSPTTTACRSLPRTSRSKKSCSSP